ncbi:DUF7935 family protein [Namhaeicola litoreus]|uniref:DUF2726 domain-containing protein n=1 Tax=Namhaeicola litoreus TaxID=1052145 RepID=A0ABW3Y7H5_9FLAO
MDSDKILEIIAYCLPALITGGVALYFFKDFVKNENQRRIFLVKRENQKLALPLRLQAYERMALFLERISFSKLLVRVKPSNASVSEYQNKLILHIEQEFEHNLTQQIYISDNGWNAIVSAKNAQIQIIRAMTADKSTENAEHLREKLLQKSTESESPTAIALSLVKNEVRSIF